MTPIDLIFRRAPIHKGALAEEHKVQPRLVCDYYEQGTRLIHLASGGKFIVLRELVFCSYEIDFRLFVRHSFAGIFRHEKQDYISKKSDHGGG